jgi:HEPN domain-containing protein
MKEDIERLKNWIVKGDHDLGTAIVVANHIPMYADTIAFHCQQAVEKYLKCLLEYNSISFKRSHDLRYLLDLLSESIMISEEHYNSAMKLNGFGADIRYPDATIDLTDIDRDEAIQIAKEFRNFLKANIAIEIDNKDLP